MEKSKAAHEVEVESLKARVERLEQDLDLSRKSEEKALEAKEEALKAKEEASKSKELAMLAQIEAMKAKEALFQEKKRMEEIFAREVKGKASLQKMSISGRYYTEKDKAKTGEYIDLYEDGTLLLVAPENEKKSLINSVTGTYKLNGNRITLILNLFTMSNAVDGRIEGNRIILIDEGKEKVYIRQK